MKKKRLIIPFIGISILVFSMFAFTSCGECKHQWGEWSVSSQSTCSAQGTKQRKCSKCDMMQSQSIDIADHEYDTENLVWTWNGYESATATLSCITDSTHTRQINANVTDEVTSAPTCTATGTKTYTATVTIDGVTYTATKNETLAALGHTEVTDAAVAATCEKIGLTEGSHCSVCKEVLVAQQETPKAAHTETKIEAVAATCSAEGATEGVKCSVCGEILVAPQPTSKMDHTEEILPAVAATCQKAGLTEGKKCSACGEVLIAQTETALGSHAEEILPAVAATCQRAGLTEGKKCSVCKDVLIAQQATNKLPHTETTLLAVSPSCSKEGLTEGKKCSVCKTVIVAQKSIDKLPHTEEIVVGTESTCFATGLSDGKKCSVCNETLVAQTILPKIACHYESVITAPTCEEQGYTTHTCSMCTDSFVDAYVEKLGHNWGAWEVSSSYTIRNCTNDCNCGKYQRITSINATYNGIRLLTGESVWKDDVLVTITISDNSSIKITDFTLDNTVMQQEGANFVQVSFMSLSTTVAVPAIHANLDNTTSTNEFEFETQNGEITITKFIGSSSQVVIPAHINRIPVRHIANSSFENCTTIVSVTVPPSIKCIGEYAFYNCQRLTTLNLSEGLESIRGGAFAYCPLTSLTIPDTVIRLSHDGCYGVFEDCRRLTRVTIGNNLIVIDESTFRYCTSLEEVIIGSSVQEIGTTAFENCSSLKTLTVPSCVQTIGDHAFANCTALTNVIFNSGLQQIKWAAFQNCSSLKDLDIPSSVQTIEDYAFADCTALQTARIPTHTQIHDTAFEGCDSLSKQYH